MCDAAGDDRQLSFEELYALIADSSKPPRARAEYAIEMLARLAAPATAGASVEREESSRAQAVLLSLLVDYDDLAGDVRRYEWERRDGA